MSPGNTGAIAPESACPVIAAFLHSWNDALPTDEERNRLVTPLIPRLAHTRNESLEKNRSALVATWFVSIHAPAWLRLAALNVQEDAYAAMESARDASLAKIAAQKAVLNAAGDEGGASPMAMGKIAVRQLAWLVTDYVARKSADAAAGDAAFGVAQEIAWDADWDEVRVEAWRATGLPAWYTAKNTYFLASWDLAKAAAAIAALEAAKVGKGAVAGDAWDATWEAAMVGARLQAWRVVRDTAEVAAGDAAYAVAGVAARDAAAGAASDEGGMLAKARAYAAAKSAARVKLAPTVAELQ